MILIPDVTRRAIVAALIGAGGLLDALVVKLYTNDVTPGRHSVGADFTEATFDGYAASAAVAWGSVFTDAAGQATVVGDTKQFTCTGGTTPQTVYGYTVQTAGGIVRFGERFDTPVPITGVGDAVVLVPRFNFGQ
jgi:hypothetical protein